MTRRQTITLIAGREVRQRLRSKLFVWSTILLSVAFAVLALVPTLLDAFSSPDDEVTAGDVTTLAVVTRSPRSWGRSRCSRWRTRPPPGIFWRMRMQT